jgi:elongation factor 2
MELKLTGEELYLKLAQIIESVNALFAKYEDEILGEITVDPRKGNISFGSGKQGWAFTLPQYARVLAKKMQVDPMKILPHLWGDEYYDPEAKKFTSKPTSKSGKPLNRFVVEKLFNPLVKLFNEMISGNTAFLFDEMLPKIGVKLTRTEKEQTDRNKFIKSIMQKWLPAADALVEMIIDHLPSPKSAQRYRVENLYTGPLDDDIATAIRNCDPNGPLIMFVSKMIDANGDGKRYYAFGRVFSGTIRTQQEVYVMGPNYVFGEKFDIAEKKVPGLVLIMGSKINPISELPCGNTVGVSGLDKVLIKSGTISSSPKAYPISPMKFSVAAVVRRAVSPKNPSQLKKFTEGLKRLEKADPCLQVIYSDNEFIVAGAGELHIEVAMKEFQSILGGEVPFTVSPPVVPFSETITEKSKILCLGKSPNRHNRLYFTAQPLGEPIATDLELKRLDTSDFKVLSKQLEQYLEWDNSANVKIWNVYGTNMLVDVSHGIQYLNEIKDDVVLAFKETVDQSVICGEPLRGVRFNLTDATLHADTVHRGTGQIVPAARRVMAASILSASPTLCEPIYLAEIQTEQEVIGKIYSCVSKRRGHVIEETPKIGSPMTIVKALIPVMESFGFTTQLREETSGRAFPQLAFHNWKLMDGSLQDDSSMTVHVVMDVRKRKRMKLEIPVIEQFNDKL